MLTEGINDDDGLVEGARLTAGDTVSFTGRTVFTKEGFVDGKVLELGDKEVTLTEGRDNDGFVDGAMLTEGENVPLTLGDNKVGGILEGFALAEGVNDRVGWLDGAALTEGSDLPLEDELVDGTVGIRVNDGSFDGTILTDGDKVTEGGNVPLTTKEEFIDGAVLELGDGLVEDAILTEGDNVPLTVPEGEVEGLTLEVVLTDGITDTDGVFDGETDGSFDGRVLAEGTDDNDVTFPSDVGVALIEGNGEIDGATPTEGSYDVDGNDETDGLDELEGTDDGPAR